MPGLAAIMPTTIVEHCAFDYMRGRADRLAPFNGAHMSSAAAFFHQGPNRDYRSELTTEQVARFDRVALDRLGVHCSRWLETGRLPGAGEAAAGLR